MNIYLGSSLIIIALITGIGIGFSFTPEYARMNSEKQNPMMELGNADRYTDLRYIDGMIAHHKAAIYVLEQAQNNSKRKEIQDLATAVIAADKKGIEELYTMKKAWYNDTREITRFQKVNLGNADSTFDLRLLNALITHHDEAIRVANDIQTKSTRTEILQLASNVQSSLSANKEQLQQWRSEWYGVK